MRAPLDAWNRQDINDILALTDPEASTSMPPVAVEPGTRRGHDESPRRSNAVGGLPGASQEIDRFHDRGDEIITVGPCFPDLAWQ